MLLKVKRQCNGCTACCAGELSLDIFSEKYIGRPCQFLGEKGCTIYEDRPHKPCKTFECEWLKDKDYTFPEWLKPNKSGLILKWKRTKTNIKYIMIIPSKDGYSNEAFLWLVDYANQNSINLEVLFSSKKWHIGSKEFRNFFKK